MIQYASEMTSASDPRTL